MRLTFRLCREADLPVLDRLNPSPSVESFHHRRFATQREGDGDYLIARHRGRPVANALIMWRGCTAEEVRRHHPGVPEINGLDVFPPGLRGRGIGTALVAACEQRARAAGADRIGLGVADANPRAAALYHRLGYRGDVRYIDRYTCVDSLGTRHRFADPCVFLVKDLDRTVRSTSLNA
ncbi:acetyltransferase (GNAT) family protein [Stackebrandtia albiflava]|uniref:Acetyltransferase (GNAT) family protein n=1 Tax=Stackebrandtia albiflava TaxID=406432 RepID=A0A562VDP4_9ACTN|nr:GNAT family N-acetyltransferase [Stackebrandtia albiflava]TWJ15982.1 acetyltransferase (GNAT) family protein [Stackebrandtia albiflava]